MTAYGMIGIQVVWKGKNFIHNSQKLWRNSVINRRKEMKGVFPCVVTFYPSILYARCDVKAGYFGINKIDSQRNSTIYTISELRFVHLVKVFGIDWYKTSPAQWLLTHYISIDNGLKIDYEIQVSGFDVSASSCHRNISNSQQLSWFFFVAPFLFLQKFHFICILGCTIIFYLKKDWPSHTNNVWKIGVIIICRQNTC